MRLKGESMRDDGPERRDELLKIRDFAQRERRNKSRGSEEVKQV